MNRYTAAELGEPPDEPSALLTQITGSYSDDESERQITFEAFAGTEPRKIDL